MRQLMRHHGGIEQTDITARIDKTCIQLRIIPVARYPVQEPDDGFGGPTVFSLVLCIQTVR
jgi:hypothetical protein